MTIALADTNLFLRALVNDHEYHQKAIAVFDKARSKQLRLVWPSVIFGHYSKFTGNIVNLRSNERQETNNGRGEPAGTRRIHADRERAGREPGGGSPGADNPTKSELPATAVPMVWQIKLSG